MTIKRRTEEVSVEEALESQIGNAGAPEATEDKGPHKKQLLHDFSKRGTVDAEEMKEIVENKNLSRLGDKISQTAQFRDGWMDVDRTLLGERNVFYPESWQFKILPANVEAIKNWSTIDESNPNSIDDVFDEILKNCLSINNGVRNLPWHSINSWDRLFFVLLIREYTMINGQKNIQFTRECPNCGKDVEFKLTSTALMYDMPDSDVMNYYNPDNQTWDIVPSDFDVAWPGVEYIQLYLPTREKDANIKAWLISKLQENRDYKVDQVFLKFLPWMLPKIAKDVNIAKNQIRKAEIEFKGWSIDQFTFMDEVIRNIVVTPGTNILSVCSCGEEVTAPIQFPDGIGALFDVVDRRKRFGKK